MSGFKSRPEIFLVGVVLAGVAVLLLQAGQGAPGSEPGADSRESAQRWSAVHAADLVEYRAWLARMKAQGFRPVLVSACEVEHKPTFAAIALKEQRKVPWEASEELDSKSYQRSFTSLSQQGYRPVSSTGYLSAGQPRFACLWVKDGRPENWFADHGLTRAELPQASQTQRENRLHPVEIKGYSQEKEARFMTLFDAQGPPPLLQYNLTDAEYQQAVVAGAEKSYRPLSASANEVAGQLRFSLLLCRNEAGIPWIARHGLIPEAFLQEHKDSSRKGFRPQIICGYIQENALRYVAVWVKDEYGIVPLPATGQTVPQLLAFDRAMLEFMGQRDIRAGALAVRKDGRLVLARGYGFLDREEKRLVQPETPFRLASVTKPFTAAVIQKLCRDGKLKLDTKVYGFLDLKPLPGQKMDQRWRDITIQHLLDHEGGWDRDTAFDPMFRPLAIARFLGKRGPATAADVIQYMVGKPLQFAPGSKSAYSNFGYCLLGRVIEKVTGKSYFDALQHEILTPLDLKNVALGRSLPRDRDPREPSYASAEKGRNVVEPNKKERVAGPDGTFYLEAMDAHGGLIASAPDVLRFMEAYDINGTPTGRLAQRSAGCFFGSLPGTWTMVLWRADGVQIVALFNRRQEDSGPAYEKIEEIMNRTARQIKHWPAPPDKLTR